MIRDFADNAEVLEYLNGFCFSLARITEENDVVEWDSLASICDQRYFSLNQGDPKPLDAATLDALYNKYEQATKTN